MSFMDHHTRRVGTNVLLVKDGKVLLARRSNTGWADGKLGIPGGHLEEGETARQAAAREVKEELGLSIELDRLIFFATGTVRTTQEYIYEEFYVELKAEEVPVNKEPEKCSELVWCDPHDLPPEVQETFRIFITDGYVNGKQYFEIGY